MRRNRIWMLLFVFLCLSCSKVPSSEKLADAIYHAEGVNSKYPYGVMYKYGSLSPRQICLNTINHAKRDWDKRGDFVEFLGKRYCPVETDIWVKNVKYFLKNTRYKD